MPNKRQHNTPTPGDLIGNKALRLRVSLTNGRAECLCHVYALVLKDIGSMLGAVGEENTYVVSKGPENENEIQSIINALDQIYLKLSYFKLNSKIRESCPEYSALLYSDINALIPLLNLIIRPLENMARLYNLAKLDLKIHPEMFEASIKASYAYEGYLRECREHIIAINERVEWWCERLSPQGCQGQKAAG